MRRSSAAVCAYALALLLLAAVTRAATTTGSASSASAGSSSTATTTATTSNATSTSTSTSNSTSSSSCRAQVETWNTSTNQCSCATGFYGMNCGMCQSTDYCEVFSTSSSSSKAKGTKYACKGGLEYRSSSDRKTYQCQLDSTLQSLIPDGEFTIACDRTKKTCTGAVFQTKETWRGEHVIHCDLTACTFTDGSADVSCGLAMCKCGSYCSSTVKVLVEGSLSNKPAKIKVKNATVTIDVEGAPLPLSAVCTAATCEVDTGSSSSGSGSLTEPSKEENIRKIELAACALVVVLLLLCVCCGSCCVKANHNMKPVPGAVVDRAIGLLTARSTKKLTFKHINCQVTDAVTKQTKRILEDISGYAARGQVLGLLGPSGCGKTSLLNTLAAVENGQCHTTGEIKVDGRKIAKDYRRVAAYVQQDDALFATLTVRECLQYSAELRLPRSIPYRVKYEMVSRVIAELNLGKVEHSRIGGVSGSKTRGISGGERRRVSIGMELVTCPQIIFLDEPTSGLDSHSANSVVQLVKDLADHGRMVVLSIHQPSARAFMLLDQIVLLAAGKVMYQGSPRNVKQHFERAGFECPENENVADFILEVASDLENQKVLRGVYLSESHQQRPSPAQPRNAKRGHARQAPRYVDGGVLLETPPMDDAVNSPSSPQALLPQDDESPFVLHVSTPPPSQMSSRQARLPKQSKRMELKVLFYRTALNTFRHRSLLLLHIALSVVLGLGGGLIFNHVTNDLAGFQNRSGAFYFILTFFGFASLSSMDLFIAERTIFLRETGAMYYGAFSYFIAKAILDTVFLRVIPAFIFASIFYWIMGLQESAEHFIMFLVALVLFNIAAGSISILIGVVSRTVGVANLAATVVYLISLLFGGFLLNVDTMPGAVAWIKHTSIFSYAFEVLMGNELKGLLLHFNAPGYPSVPVYGDVFLKTLGMYYENRYTDLVALGVLSFVLQLLAFIFLWWQVPVRQQLQDDSGEYDDWKDLQEADTITSADDAAR